MKLSYIIKPKRKGGRYIVKSGIPNTCVRTWEGGERTREGAGGGGGSLIVIKIKALD